MKDIYPDIKEPKFRDHLVFVISSWLGRNFKKHKSKISPKDTPLLLDLGCGNSRKDGWTHVDFYRFSEFKFWKNYPSSVKPAEIETDLRYPLNCQSNIVDGVYSGHTLEHLYPNHAYKLLGEVFRVLKPKCWVRINVPDLKRAVDFYNGEITIPEYKYKAEAIAHWAQNWGHVSVWDEELLSKALEISGFINIRKVEYGKEGTDGRLIKEEEDRRINSLVIEAQKP